MEALQFICPPLINLVSKINTKLLCSELINRKSALMQKKVNQILEKDLFCNPLTLKEDSNTKDYALLNSFELLWNLDR